jgi:PAS domain S-box-containing protein
MSNDDSETSIWYRSFVDDATIGRGRGVVEHSEAKGDRPTGWDFRAPVAVFRYRVYPDGRDEVLQISPGCEVIWEFDADTITRDTGQVWAMVHPDDAPGLQASIEQSARDMSPWEHEWRIKTPSGVQKWLQGRGVPEPGEDGAILWDSVIIDFTLYKGTEAALRESERRFRDLAENIPGAIFRYVLRPDGTDAIDYMSSGCEEVWELSAHHIQGNPSALWSMVDKRDLPEMAESVRRSAETGEPWRHLWRITTPSGKQKWLEGRGVPTEQGQDGTVWNTLILDITEQKAAESELVRLARAATAADRAKTQFLANMSHELRTPLNSIIGFTDVMRNETFGAIGNPKYQEYTELVHRSAQHLLKIIGDVLDVSMIEAGEEPLHEETVEIAPIFAFIHDVMRDRFSEKAIAYELDLPADLPRIHVDELKIKRAILNIVANAAQHTPVKGFVRVSVRQREGGGLGIEVADSGTGIPESEVARLLQPFTRAHESHLVPGDGAGLGLYITKSIMEMHDGGIRIGRSDLGGASVMLSLPSGRVSS